MLVENEKDVKLKEEKLHNLKISLIKAYGDLIELLENTNDTQKSNFYKKQLEEFIRKELLEQLEKEKLNEEVVWIESGLPWDKLNKITKEIFENKMNKLEEELKGLEMINMIEENKIYDKVVITEEWIQKLEKTYYEAKKKVEDKIANID